LVASASFAEFLREQLAPLGSITMRRMFGKTGVFCDGLMLGMVRDNTLYFRVDDENRAAFKEAESFAPLNYEKQGQAEWRDDAKMPHTAMNIAAITGPITKPLMPKIAMPPSVEISTT
jgi:TfoX/Sxy family transcriptional regulator of competence genes